MNLLTCFWPLMGIYGQNWGRKNVLSWTKTSWEREREGFILLHVPPSCIFGMIIICSPLLLLPESPLLSDGRPLGSVLQCCLDRSEMLLRVTVGWSVARGDVWIRLHTPVWVSVPSLRDPRAWHCLAWRLELDRKTWSVWGVVWCPSPSRGFEKQVASDLWPLMPAPGDDNHTHKHSGVCVCVCRHTTTRSYKPMSGGADLTNAPIKQDTHACMIYSSHTCRLWQRGNKKTTKCVDVVFLKKTSRHREKQTKKSRGRRHKKNNVTERDKWCSVKDGEWVCTCLHVCSEIHVQS